MQFALSLESTPPQIADPQATRPFCQSALSNLIWPFAYEVLVSRYLACWGEKNLLRSFAYEILVSRLTHMSHRHVHKLLRSSAYEIP